MPWKVFVFWALSLGASTHSTMKATQNSTPALGHAPWKLGVTNTACLSFIETRSTANVKYR